MRAAYYEQTGPAENVLRHGEIPDPLPGPGELRVRLRWSGVNPSDVKMRAGRGGAPAAVARIVPHSDGMGVVDAVGSGVDASRLGRRVWTWNAAYGRQNGTAAQYVVLPQAQAVDLPDNVLDEAGACLGIPALTALHALLTDGGIAGQRVLVAGGAGAVGFYAIQFARLLGAIEVITTVSSAEKGVVAEAAGATRWINYRNERVAEAVLEATHGAGVDRVIEVDVAANARLDLELMKEGGTWVLYGSGAPEFQLPFLPMINKAVLARFFSVYRLEPQARARTIALLDCWLREDRVRHLVAARYPLSEVAAAHAHVEAGTAIGNVLLSID
jgi:NADPH2:quinone reductase